ncbi:PqqD family protein [Thomasclavelia sp.]|uniref:PqqD family protein n=1 Tax=Thomasclavelia sp. TaxID=3025757 RepID=UPI0025EA7709|nr:PqqD family protein [Thomasclavelia sp.]
MKRNKNFILRKIAGESIIVPTGEATTKFNGLFSPNPTATFVWEHIEEVANLEEMIQLVLEHFDIDEKTARTDIEGFIKELKLVGFVEE